MTRKLLRLVVSLCLVCLPIDLHARTEVPNDSVPFYKCPPCGCSHCDSTFAQPGACPGCGMELILEGSARTVAILVYNGVEILDFTGPYEVFAADYGHFEVFTVSPDSGMITTGIGSMTMQPDYTIANCPLPDILVIPGGGTGGLMRNEAVLEFIRSTHRDAEIIMSVCTGAFVLAAAGLLNGLEATTHSQDAGELQQEFPSVTVRNNRRYIDTGKIITAAGVSSGIDAALHVIDRLHGSERADDIARYLEYPRRTG